MKRLIDADAFLKEYCEPYPHIYKAMKTAFEHAPTIDAVPVIRCEDCRHAQKSVFKEKFKRCDYTMHLVSVADFCSWAERRGEE